MVGGFGCLVFCGLLLDFWVLIVCGFGFGGLDVVIGRVWLVLFGLLFLNL